VAEPTNRADASEARPRRALVLGGGGVAGIAWEVGVLAGLAEAGLDLTDADTVIGTSAGSVVGALIGSGTPLADIYAVQSKPGRPRISSPRPAPKLDRALLGSLFSKALSDATSPEEARARIGAVALAAKTESEAERRAAFTARFPVQEWPERWLQITAVDAESGAEQIFDRDSGVTIADALEASCAVPGVWPPVSIGDRRFIDGGVRSMNNADLAVGYERVVVLAPMSGYGPDAILADQIERLQSAGAQVALVTPGVESLGAFGVNPLDPAVRVASALAGRAQAPSVLNQVATTWK
jgi:NTE family protein